MSVLERALRELECATAIVAAPAQDLDSARAALDRRQRAIADVTRLTGVLRALSSTEREETARRLLLVSEAGAVAELWLVAVKGEVMMEWNQWSQIYRALGAVSASKSTLVDFNC